MLTRVTGADQNLIAQAVKDLSDRGLLPTMNIGTTMTTQGFFQRRSTPLGQQFLAFVSRPPELD